MRHRPVVTLLMLMIAMTLALPAGMQQKPFAQGQWEVYRLRMKSTGASPGGLANKRSRSKCGVGGGRLSRRNG
jgi:hypothetical protein